MPRGVYERSKEVEVNVQTVGADISIPTEGALNRGDLVQEVEPHGDMVNFNEKAEKLKFMEEPVTIFLQEAGNAAEEPSVYVAVNGEPALPHQPWLLRGREYTVKRKFVEVLARARTTTYTQPFQHDREPDRVNIFRPHSSMRYPFMIVEDANPRGRAWAKALMAA